MITLQAVKEAHAKVKTGADFPRYVQDLKKLDVRKYDTYVSDGHTMFFGDDNFQIKSKPKYATLIIANISDKERFKHFLRIHQRGQTDYAGFCRHAAETGVEKWTVNMAEMSCTYYDKLNTKMLVEEIPA